MQDLIHRFLKKAAVNLSNPMNIIPANKSLQLIDRYAFFTFQPLLMCEGLGSDSFNCLKYEYLVIRTVLEGGKFRVVSENRDSEIELTCLTRSILNLRDKL